MLVLTRKEGEEIVLTVGDVEITVALIHIQHHKARLGITAPREVRVRRSELPRDHPRPEIVQ